MSLSQTHRLQASSLTQEPCPCDPCVKVAIQPQITHVLLFSISRASQPYCDKIPEISPGKEEGAMVLWLHCHWGCSETEHHGGGGVGLPGGRSSSQLMAAGNPRGMCSQYPTQGCVSHGLISSSGAFFLSFDHLPTPPTQLGTKP